jgi:O-antigen ligase
MKAASTIRDDLNQTAALPAGLLITTADLLDKAIFIGCLALMVLVSVPYGTVDIWWEAVFECAVFLLTAMWIIQGLLGGWKFKGLFVLLPLIAMTLYAFAQTIHWPAGWFSLGTPPNLRNALTIDNYQTYLTARKTLALTLFLGMLLSHTSSPSRFRWLIRVTIALGVGSAIFGIVRQFAQRADSDSGFGLSFLYPGVGYGQFISANVFAYLMEMVFGLLIGLILGAGLKRDRLLVYSVVAIIVWTALVLSGSRGAMIGLGCQVFFVLVVSFSWYAERQETASSTIVRIMSSRVARILATVLIVSTLIAGVIWVGADNLAWKFQGSQMPNATSQQGAVDGETRKEIWRSTWNLIKRNPWTGVGFGAYYLAIPQHQSVPTRTRAEQAHNDYLDLAANGGLVAVVFAGWFAWLVLSQTRKRMRSKDPYRRAACLGGLAAILSVAVHSLVDFGLQVTSIALVFAAIIVVVTAAESVETLRLRKRANEAGQQ